MKRRTFVLLLCVVCCVRPLLAIAAEPPFANDEGDVEDVLAAYAFLQRTADVEQLHAAAARKEDRPLRVWAGLEDFVRELGTGIADRATAPYCMVLPVGCTPDWSKFDALPRTQPGGIQLRQVLVDAFKSEAHRRGLENKLVANLVSVALAGVAVKAAVGTAAASMAAAEAQPLTRVMVDPAKLRWTQSTAGGGGRAAALRESMAKHGYVGDPIDVVKTPEGLVTIDNTRPAVALELGIKEIPATIHLSQELLPPHMAGRFGPSKTWGEAAAYRAGMQRPPLAPSGSETPPRLLR